MMIGEAISDRNAFCLGDAFAASAFTSRLYLGGFYKDLKNIIRYWAYQCGPLGG
jgi:hypothetical protein